MYILSIGNSFSQDAQRYLHQIARAAGTEIQAFNLYIPGCPLERHFRNMLSGEREYILEVNGVSTGFKVSLQEALLSRKWDVITVQQASGTSVDYETYQPYLGRLAAFVREYSPKARLAVHQTWAYAKESPRLMAKWGYQDPAEMLRDLKDAYARAAEDIDADLVIPGGEALWALLCAGAPSVHRDCHHVSRGLGRYALGLVWYAALTGNAVTGNPFCDFDEPVSSEEAALAQKCVDEVMKKHRG